MNTHKPLIEGGWGGAGMNCRLHQKPRQGKKETRLDRPRMIKKSELGSRRELGLLGLPFKLSK